MKFTQEQRKKIIDECEIIIVGEDETVDQDVFAIPPENYDKFFDLIEKHEFS